MKTGVGKCVSSQRALELFEALKDRVADEELEEYQRAMNRMRWLARLDTELPARKRQYKKYRTEYLCPQCGATLLNAVPGKHCDECGQRYRIEYGRSDDS